MGRGQTDRFNEAVGVRRGLQKEFPQDAFSEGHAITIMRENGQGYSPKNANEIIAFLEGFDKSLPLYFVKPLHEDTLEGAMRLTKVSPSLFPANGIDIEMNNSDQALCSTIGDFIALLARYDDAPVDFYPGGKKESLRQSIVAYNLFYGRQDAEYFALVTVF